MTPEQLDDHDYEIADTRRSLADNLARAYNALTAAKGDIKRLSNTLYDIEYAEGDTGEHVSSLLADALRNVDAAIALTERANR